MNLSLKSGQPLAIFKNDDDDKYHYVYANDNNDNNQNLDNDDLTNIIQDFIMRNSELNMKEINEIYDSLKNQMPPSNKKLKILYDSIIDNKKNNIFNIDNGSMLPVFNPKEERKVYYIAGMSGSGKSTFTSKIIAQYIKMYPKNNVFLFSNKPEDPVLDKFKKLVRIELNDELLEDPITLDELKNSLVIFDDVEYTPNKEIGVELDRIRDMILQQGRSYKVSFCYISHQLTNYKQSRVILNECHSCVLFPKMTTTHSLKYLLDKYFGFTTKDISKLKNLPSRWVCVNKIPPCVIHSNGIYFVD